jgi:hypothetical protein
MARGTAFRRYQYELRKARHWRKYRRQWELPGSEITDFMLGFHANTPHPCSCYMCGNPRKYFNELTRQEIRADHPPEDGW